MKKSYKLEACVDSLDAAIKAEAQGADQIELCKRLDLDGLTPDFNLIKQVKAKVNIPVKVMIRPRPGDYYYSEDEVDDMIDAISQCRYLSIDGVVLGATTAGKKSLDFELIEELAEVAFPLKVTIHKVIDECSSPLRAITKLKDIKNVTSVLSSGKAKTAEEGIPMLRKMVLSAKDRIEIIPAGKITKDNLSLLHENLHLKYYHGRSIV